MIQEIQNFRKLYPAISTIQDLIAGEYENLIPIQGKRLWEATEAFLEGQIKTPTQEGYPVRHPRTEELRAVETAPELISRTFVARPTKESEQSKFLTKKRMIEERRKELLGDIVNAIVDKDKERVAELRKEFKGPLTTIRGLNQAVKAEMMKRKFTPTERAKVRGFAGKVGLGFRLSIGESPED